MVVAKMKKCGSFIPRNFGYRVFKFESESFKFESQRFKMLVLDSVRRRPQSIGVLGVFANIKKCGRFISRIFGYRVSKFESEGFKLETSPAEGVCTGFSHSKSSRKKL